MTPTNEQLKQALARLTPHYRKDKLTLDWAIFEDGHWRFCHDTELLALCTMVEKGLTEDEQLDYVRCLDEDIIRQFLGKYGTYWLLIHATWQQRVTALCKVKGITI